MAYDSSSINSARALGAGHMPSTSPASADYAGVLSSGLDVEQSTQVTQTLGLPLDDHTRYNHLMLDNWYLKQDLCNIEEEIADLIDSEVYEVLHLYYGRHEHEYTSDAFFNRLKQYLGLDFVQQKQELVVLERQLQHEQWTMTSQQKLRHARRLGAQLHTTIQAAYAHKSCAITFNARAALRRFYIMHKENCDALMQQTASLLDLEVVHTSPNVPHPNPHGTAADSD